MSMNVNVRVYEYRYPRRSPVTRTYNVRGRNQNYEAEYELVKKIVRSPSISGVTKDNIRECWKKFTSEVDDEGNKVNPKVDFHTFKVVCLTLSP